MGQVCCLSQCLFRKGESHSHPRQPFYAVSSIATAMQHVSKRFGDARKKLAIEVEEAKEGFQFLHGGEWRNSTTASK